MTTENKKPFDRGDEIYIRAKVIGTVIGMNSGNKYAVLLPDGKTTAYVHEKDTQPYESR